jgi:hypothetical protein
MSTPKVVSLKVVAGSDGGKKFLAPKDLWLVGRADGEVAEGKLYYSIHAGSLGSWRPYDASASFFEEIDSPCLLFRDGRSFDRGLLEYSGSQENGYHVVEGFKKLGWTENIGPATELRARWFEVGDVLVVAYYPHPASEKREPRR